MENINPDLFADYSRLVTITLEGRPCEVPENNNILRAFQFLGISLINAKLCWNGECESCLFAYRESEGGKIKMGLACQQLTFDGMIITQLPQGIRINQ